MPWESKIRGLHNGMVEKTRQKVVLSLRRQRGSSLRQQSSALSRADMSRGALTQTAGLSLEQSIAGTEASRDAPEGWRGRG